MIAEKILSNRKVFLWGNVDDASAKHVIETLLYLELRDPEKEIQLIINSPGGYVTSGFAIYDTIKRLAAPFPPCVVVLQLPWRPSYYQRENKGDVLF